MLNAIHAQEDSKAKTKAVWKGRELAEGAEAQERSGERLPASCISQ
jgi:hypothetical protein